MFKSKEGAEGYYKLMEISAFGGEGVRGTVNSLTCTTMVHALHDATVEQECAIVQLTLDYAALLNLDCVTIC